MTNLERQEKIRLLKSKGKSFKEIADIFKVSRQRIQQIIVKDYSVSSVRPFIDDCELCDKSYRNPGYLNQKYCDECSSKLDVLGGRERTREACRIKANYTCQKCGKVWDESMRRFDVHHVYDRNRNKTRAYDSINDIFKMTVLCHKCHMNLPSTKRSMKNIRKLTTAKEARVRLLSSKGLTMGEIAKVVSLSYPIIQNVLSNPK